MASNNIRGVIIECSFCLCTFNDPRLLPCGHTFCLQCLISQVSTTTTEAAQNENCMLFCALCRKPWKLPDGGVKNLPKNYCVADIEDDLMSDVQDDGSRRCLCEGSGDGRDWLCLDCHKSMCDFCYGRHLLGESTKHHAVVSLVENKSEPKPKNAYCVIHKEEKLTLYCVQCEQVVCSICYVKAHLKHEATEIVATDEQVTNELAELEIDLQRRLKQCNDRRICLEETRCFYADQEEQLKREVKEWKENAQRQLCDAYREMECAIKQEEDNALQIIGAKLLPERQKIDLDLDKNAANSCQLRSIIDYCTRHVKESSIAEKLSAKRRVRQQISSLAAADDSALSHKTLTISEYVPPYNVSFSVASSRLLYSIDQSLGQLTTPELQGPVNILHVLGDFLLAASFGQCRFCIYHLPTSTIQHITTVANVRDAILIADHLGVEVGGTINVNVVYAMDNNQVAVGALRESGLHNIKSTLLPQPYGLSIDGDGAIYAANWNGGVYRSCDGALTWHLYLSPDDSRLCWRIVCVKPPSDKGANGQNSLASSMTSFLWIQTYDILQLVQVSCSSECSQNKPKASVMIAARDITNDETVNVGSIAYDGQDCVFVSDRRRKCVMLYSSLGVYRGDLIGTSGGLENPWAIAFNAAQSVLFVGDTNGCVNAFKLNSKQRPIFELSMV